MKKINLVLIVVLVVQLTVLAVLSVKARDARERALAESKIISKPTSETTTIDDAQTHDLAQARTIVEKLRSGELDPFASPKTTKRPPPSQTASPKGRLSKYDRMVATTEGGALVRAEIADKIEQTYQHELAALRLSPDERHKVTTILTDLEMAKVDIQTLSTSIIPYAEFDRLYRAAVADDLKRLEEILGSERYNLARETYTNGRAHNSAQAFVDECNALGIPLSDTAKVSLESAWKDATAAPAGMVIGSPLRSDRRLMKTDWDKLQSSAAPVLNSEQQTRLAHCREQANQP